MPSLKIIRKRISSVKSTQQITKAMQMVAAAKLRRAQDAATQARPYADKLSEQLTSVAARVGDAASNPLLATRAEKVVDIILVTSDRGLCGGYNSNLIRTCESLLADKADCETRLTVIGTKGSQYFKNRGRKTFEEHIGLAGGPDHPLAVQLGNRVSRDYAGGETDAVYVVYNKFNSAISQVPTVEKLLPVSGTDGDEDQQEESLADYIYEPDPSSLLGRLLAQYINTLIYRSFLEANASEHAARMTAMDSATSNASDMMERLTLEMNRARQAAITTELMEIVSGAESLKG